MVIRRIREHVSTHNWFAVAVDLGIVVLGVFLGTQVSNWNDDRLERAAAADYRQQIVDDLKENIADLAGRKAYYVAVRNHALAALAAIEEPERSRGEPFLVDAYQASQVWLRPLARTAYDEMIGAGLSNRVGNQETRSRLTAFYTQLRQFDLTALGVTSYRERLRRSMPYEVQDAVRKQCGDRVTTNSNGAQMAALPAKCSLDLDVASIAVAESAIKSAELRDDLTRLISDIDQKISAFDQFSRLARVNQRLLESHDGQ